MAERSVRSSSAAGLPVATILPLRGRLDLPLTLAGGQAFRWHSDGDGWWIGPFQSSVVRIRVADAAGASYLEVVAEPTPTTTFLADLLRYLDAENGFAHTQMLLRENPRLVDAVDGTRGLRLLRQDPWECLAAFILSTQSNIPRIRRNVEALARVAGEGIPAFGRVWYAFPDAVAVARLGETLLRELGFGFRAPSLALTARRIADPASWGLESLRNLPFEEARSSLMGLPGVGPKVADCVLAFSLGHSRAFPVDRWVMRALQRRYGDEVGKTPEQVGAWARAQFGEHGAYVQQVLFQAERGRDLREEGHGPNVDSLVG